MKLPIKILLYLCLLVLVLMISSVPAQEPTANIHPSKGTIYTKILLQVRGLEIFVQGDNLAATRLMELYLYWDNIPLITGLGDPTNAYGTHLHYFDVELSPWA